MTEQFDLPFSLQCCFTIVEPFDMHYFFRLMHPGIVGASAILVLHKPFFHVFSVSSVVTAILAKDNVNIEML